MFDFLKSGYSELKSQLSSSRKDAEDWRNTAWYWRKKYSKLIDEYNDLVEEINRKGGREFLNHAKIPGKSQQNTNLTQSQLKTLLILVHPDKHGSGKHGKMAEELFKTIQSLLK